MKSFLRSFSSLPLINSRRVVVSYKRKYVQELLVNLLFKLAQEKSVVRWTDRPHMSIAGYWDVKQQNKQTLLVCLKRNLIILQGPQSIGLMWWLLAREVLRLRGTISREHPWEVMVDLYFYRDPEEVSSWIINLAEMLTRPSFEPVHEIWYLTTFYMGESFRIIPEFRIWGWFSVESQPQNAESGRL